MPDPTTISTHLQARRAGTLLAADIATAKVFSPQLGALIAGIKPHAGSSRSSMTVPISPEPEPRDTMVFESPGNPSETFYLPRYRLATVTTDRGEQFRVLMQKQDPGTKLTVVLEPFVPPEVQAAAPQATPIAHEVEALLSFDIPGGAGMKREWPFSDRRAVDDGLELSLVRNDLADRGEMFAALTSPEAHATLVVRRTLSVAVPTAADAPDLLTQILVPWAREPRLHVTREAVEPELVVPVPAVVLDPPPRFVVPDPGPDLAIRNLATFRGRSLRRQVAGLRAERALLDRVGELEGRFDPAILVALPVDPIRVVPEPPQPAPVEQLYRATTRSLDQTVTPSPFVFSPQLHGYLFGDVTGTAEQGGMALHQLAFEGRHHSYYVQPQRPEVVYYLPDSFKLARIPQRPRAPLMSVVFASEDGVAENSTAIVVFAASPTVSDRRLEAASAQLATRISGVGGTPLGVLDLQPLLADSSRLTLRVSLPGSAGSTTTLPDALIDLRAGLQAGFEVPLTQFQSMFDALHSANPHLLIGEVEVRLDRPDRPAEQIPLSVRMDDLAGPVLDISLAAGATPGRHHATILNAIESPVRMAGVEAFLPQPDGPLACLLEGLPDPLPDLAAGASLMADVVPGSPPQAPDIEPVVTVTGVSVLPDAPAIWESICEDTTSHISREVTVKAPPQLFAAPADGSSAIIELVVELGGITGGLTQTISLNEAATQQVTSIAVPIADLVLRREDTGSYRYRVTTVRPDRVVDGDWKTRSSAILWIVSQDVG
ncbi:MAG: hypothetical protein WAU30_06105 [Propionicimonas sp.]